MVLQSSLSRSDDVKISGFAPELFDFSFTITFGTDHSNRGFLRRRDLKHSKPRTPAQPLAACPLRSGALPLLLIASYAELTSTAKAM